MLSQLLLLMTVETNIRPLVWAEMVVSWALPLYVVACSFDLGRILAVGNFRFLPLFSFEEADAKSADCNSL